jgi:uncharacterized protein
MKNSMSQRQILEKLSATVKLKMSSESSGHDWWHVYRVWKIATHLAKDEKADLFVVELGALLHDIADYKFHGGDESIGPRVAREMMEELKVDPKAIDHVCEIIAHLSFKGAGVENQIKTLEGKVVQDADRLDAIGAMGIARAFAYGGHKGRSIHNPDVKPTLHQTKEAYKSNESTSINHFYEKLLLLKDRLNTQAAKRIAQGRHEFMEEYLRRFLAEWEGVE